MAYLFTIAKAQRPGEKYIAKEQEEYQHQLGLSSDDMMAAVIEESKREADKSNMSKHVAAFSLLMSTLMAANNAWKKPEGKSKMSELERQSSLGLTEKELMALATSESQAMSVAGEKEARRLEKQLRARNLFMVMTAIRTNGGCFYDSIAFLYGLANGQITSFDDWKIIRHQLSLSIREACCTWLRTNKVLLILLILFTPFRI